jgi:hypothetical protein
MTVATSESVTARLVRAPKWHGVRAGDLVEVDGARERRQRWVFVAHVVNVTTNEEWIEVRGGRPGEAKGRSFRTGVIYPRVATSGSRRRAMSLDQAPQLELG